MRNSAGPRDRVSTERRADRSLDCGCGVERLREDKGVTKLTYFFFSLCGCFQHLNFRQYHKCAFARNSSVVLERGGFFFLGQISLFPFVSSLTPSEECNVVGLLCSRPGCPRPEVTLDVLSNEPKALIMLQASLQASTGQMVGDE